MRGPGHPRREELAEWPGVLDPDGFNAAAVDAARRASVPGPMRSQPALAGGAERARGRSRNHTARSLSPDALPPAGMRLQGRNERCACGSGLKFKRCHGAPGALEGEAGRAARSVARAASPFSDEDFFAPVAPDAPAALPTELAPRFLSRLLGDLKPGDDLPGPVFAGRKSPVRVRAEPVADEAAERVRRRWAAGLEAKEEHRGLPVTLFRGRTGGLMMECAAEAPTEAVASAAVAWSVAANGGNLCVWGGRMRSGRWLLGLTP